LSLLPSLLSPSIHLRCMPLKRGKRERERERKWRAQAERLWKDISRRSGIGFKICVCLSFLPPSFNTFAVYAIKKGK
jgi:hypothetical protein